MLYCVLPRGCRHNSPPLPASFRLLQPLLYSRCKPLFPSWMKHEPSWASRFTLYCLYIQRTKFVFNNILDNWIWSERIKYCQYVVLFLALCYTYFTVVEISYDPEPPEHDNYCRILVPMWLFYSQFLGDTFMIFICTIVFLIPLLKIAWEDESQYAYTVKIMAARSASCVVMQSIVYFAYCVVCSCYTGMRAVSTVTCLVITCFCTICLFRPPKHISFPHLPEIELALCGSSRNISQNDGHQDASET